MRTLEDIRKEKNDVLMEIQQCQLNAQNLSQKFMELQGMEKLLLEMNQNGDKSNA